MNDFCTESLRAFSAGLNILHTIHFIAMKRIYCIGKNKYVHMDSYNETHETHPVTNFLMALFVIGIASMTACAIVGIDITNLNSTPSNANQTR